MLRLVLFFLCFAIATNLFLPQYNIAYAQEKNTEEQPEKDQKSSEKTKKTANDTIAKDSTTPPTENAEEKKSAIISRSEINIAEPTSLFTQQLEDLQHYLPQNSLTPLLAGSDDYLILLAEHTTNINKGVVILLPDWQQAAVSSNEINYLREKLPKQGWTTITVTPPTKPDNYPSYALTLTERQKENQELLEPYHQKLTILMQALMDEAKEYPGIFVVIAQGSHAAMLVNTYQQPEVELPTALVILSAYLLTEKENTLFAENVATTELPILDLYLKKDHDLVRKNAQLRKDLTKKEMKVYYRQKELYNINSSSYPTQTLLIEINGWLKSIGW